MEKVAALILALLFIAPAVVRAAAATPFGRYHALVIGNDRYTDLPALRTAVNDAREIAAVLRERYGFEVRLAENAKRVEILTALGDYRKRLGAASPAADDGAGSAARSSSTSRVLPGLHLLHSLGTGQALLHEHLADPGLSTASTAPSSVNVTTG